MTVSEPSLLLLIELKGVVKLQAQIWCPLEVWSPTPNPEQQQPRPASVKRDSFPKIVSQNNTLRKECEDLLASLPDLQLDEVVQLLRGLKEHK
jgi:hypothetical protein